MADTESITVAADLEPIVVCDCDQPVVVCDECDQRGHGTTSTLRVTGWAIWDGPSVTGNALTVRLCPAHSGSRLITPQASVPPGDRLPGYHDDEMGEDW